jgi:hypothetical protein
MNLKETGSEECGLDSSGSGWGQVTGCFEHNSEPYGAMKGNKSWIVKWPLASQEEVCFMMLQGIERYEDRTAFKGMIFIPSLWKFVKMFRVINET